MSISTGVSVPFIEHLGITIERFESGESELHCMARPEHMNSFEIIHGGVCMTLLDVAMAVAARSVQKDMGVVTVEMKTSFMQPAVGALVAKGRLMHRSINMAFTEATVYDVRGRACSHATGTFKYVKRPPAGAMAANAQRVPPLSTD